MNVFLSVRYLEDFDKKKIELFCQGSNFIFFSLMIQSSNLSDTFEPKCNLCLHFGSSLNNWNFKFSKECEVL